MADPLSIAGSVAGLVSVGDAVARLVLRYIIAVRNAETEIQELRAETDALMGVITSLKRTVQVLEQDQRIEVTIRLDHINSCLELLYRMEKKLVKIDFPSNSTIRKSLRKLTWPYKSHETKALASDIRIRRDTLASALSATSMDALLKSLSLQENIGENLASMHDFLRKTMQVEAQIFLNERRRTILNHFLFVDPKSNFDINLSLRHPNTGFWLKENEIFKSWMRNVGKVLWLSGIPGAGKTVLSTLIVEVCIKSSSSSKGVAYFYCDYKDSSSQDPVHILGTIASQIARQNEDCFRILERYYTSLRPKHQLDSKPKAGELSGIVEQMASYFDDLRLIVDGLDECGENTRAVAKLLRVLCHHPNSNIALALLSRHETDISDVFAPPFSEHIEVAAQTEDIEHYVRTEIEVRTEDNRLRIRNPALQDEIILRLIAKAEGMFRWVSCQLDYLGTLVTDKQIRLALDELPEGLDATYRRLLQRISPKAIPIARNTLYWLSHATEKLTIDELIEIVSVDLESNALDPESRTDEETIKIICSSLLRKVNDKYLEIAHFTVKEYIASIDPKDEKIGVFSIDEARTRSILGRFCLAYLGMEDFNGAPPSSVAEHTKHMQAYPFYYHASRQWHIYVTYHWDDLDVMRRAKRLFNPMKTYNFINFCISSIIYPNWNWDQNGNEDIGAKKYERLIDVVSSRNYQPLHAAANLHLIRICKYLLHAGCDINQISPLGAPLEIAVFGEPLLFLRLYEPVGLNSNPEHSKASFVKFLLENGALCNGNSLSKQAGISTAIASSKQFRDLHQSSAFAESLLDISMEDLKPSRHYHARLGRALPVINLPYNSIDRITRMPIIDVAQVDCQEYTSVIPGNLSEHPFKEVHDKFLKELCDAIKFDQPAKIKHILRESQFLPSVQMPDGLGTALHFAAECGSVQSMALLMSTITVQEAFRLKHRGHTIWHRAAMYGELSSLQKLTEYLKDDPSGLISVSDDMMSPLGAAVWAGHATSAMYLLDKLDASGLNYILQQEPWLISHCVSNNLSGPFKQLVVRGADPRATMANGSNALFFITSKTSLELVEDLLSTGLSPEMSKNDGSTPVHAILRLDSAHIPRSCHLLDIDIGIFKAIATPSTLKICDKAGHPPWYYFCKSFVQDQGVRNSGNLGDICKVLIDNGALSSSQRLDLEFTAYELLLTASVPRNLQESRDTSIAFIHTVVDQKPSLACLGSTISAVNLLAWAILHGHNQLVTKLLQWKVDVHRRGDQIASSAIELSSMGYGSSTVFQEVLSYADIARLNELYGTNGYAVIHNICSFESSSTQRTLEKLTALLTAGADPDQRTLVSNDTPLILAAKSGFWWSFNVLLEFKADPSITNSDGMGVVAVATAANKLSMLQSIRKRSLPVSWPSKFRFHPAYFSYEEFANGHGGCNLIHCAATLLNSEVLRYLTLLPEFAADLHTASSEGFTPLHFAAEHGSLETGRLLIAKGANINALAGSVKATPLHLAVLQAHEEMVTLLLRSGAELRPDGTGLRPEELAKRIGNSKIITMIDQARKNAIERFQAHSNLKKDFYRSIMLGDLDTCRSCITSGALQMGPFGCGCLPLIYALVQSSTRVAMILLESGAPTTGQPCSTHYSSLIGVRRRNPPAWFSAAHLAVHLPLLNDCLGKILERSLRVSNHWVSSEKGLFMIAVTHNPDAIDIIAKHIYDHWSWYRFLMCLASWSSAREVLAYFIDDKASVSKGSRSGETPLMRAALLKKPAAVEKLLRHGASVQSQDAKKMTAVHFAAQSGCPHSVKALLEYGAAISPRNKLLVTPLMTAASNSHYDVLSILMQYNQDLELFDMFGRTALHHSAVAVDPHSFIHLLCMGLSPYRQNVWGETPLLEGLQNRHLRGYICNSGLELFPLTSDELGAWRNPLWVQADTTASEVRLLVKSFQGSILSTMLTKESKTWPNGTIPLCTASAHGNLEVMVVLMEAGANIEALSEILGTPLIAAVIAGQIEAVQMLVRRGAPIDRTVTYRFSTALQAALSTGRDEIVDWLIKGRFTDQKKLHEHSENSKQEIKYWSGICHLGIPLDQTWRKCPRQSCWEYVLSIRDATKSWERMVPPAEIARLSLVWEMPETIISPCVERC